MSGGDGGRGRERLLSMESVAEFGALLSRGFGGSGTRSFFYLISLIVTRTQDVREGGADGETQGQGMHAQLVFRSLLATFFASGFAGPLL